MSNKAVLWRKSVRELPSDVEGRRTLFLQLAKDHSELLSRIAIKLCQGNRDRAADCVQEAIISAYKVFEAGKFTDLHHFKPWIVRIMTNAFLLDERRQKRLLVTDEVCDIVEGKQSLGQSEPERNLIEQGFSEEIEFAFGQLPPEQRACVTLIDIEEMSYDEAADALNVPVGTIRSRLSRARMKMANEIIKFRAGGR